MAHTGAGTGFAFDGKNPDAQNAAVAQGGQAVRQISDQSRLAVRFLIHQGIRDGIPPARLARLIQQTVGLTARQARGVANLDRQLRRGGLKPSRVKARVEAYRNRQIRRRARNIARTETMGALNRGKLEAGRQATKDGLLNDPQKRWVLTPDERLCPLCAPLENETVPLEDSFSNGLDAPPRHPQCRCTPSITEGDGLSEAAQLQANLQNVPLEGLGDYDDQGYLQGHANFMAQHGVTLVLPNRAGFAKHLKRQSGVGGLTLAQARIAAERAVRGVAYDARKGLERLVRRGVTKGPRWVNHEVRISILASEAHIGSAWAQNSWMGQAGAPQVVYKGGFYYYQNLEHLQALGIMAAKARPIPPGGTATHTQPWHPSRSAYDGSSYVHEVGHVRHLAILGPHRRDGGSRSWFDYPSTEAAAAARASNPAKSKPWFNFWKEEWLTPAQKLARTNAWNKSGTKGQMWDDNHLPGLNEVIKSVSGYGNTNPLEFVAEVHRGLLGGQVFPQDTMSLYAQLGGAPVD